MDYLGSVWRKSKQNTQIIADAAEMYKVQKYVLW